MKKTHLLLALLSLSTAAFAPAQETSDFTALRTKAEKGNGIAQYNLGLAYAEGRGVAVDPLEAYVWLSLANENGARGRALDILVGAFDKATLASAQQRLAERKGISGAIPVVSTQSTPEVITTIKTSNSPAAESGNSDAAALLRQVSSLAADKKKLSEEVAQAWTEINGLKSELAKTEQELRLMRATVPDQKLKDTTAELERAGTFSRELEASLDRTNAAKAAVEQKLAAVEAELAAARSAPAAAPAPASPEISSGQFAALEAQLKTAVTEREAARVALEQEKTQFASTRTELQRQLADATAARKAAQADEAGQGQRERTELTSRVATLTRENSDLRTDRERMQKSVVESNQNLRDAVATNARLKELETQAGNLQAALTSAQAQVAALQTAAASQSAAPSYPDLSSKVQELEVQLAAANRQTESSAQTAVAASQQSASDLNSASTRIAQLQAELEAAAAKPSSPAYPDLSGRVSELETQLAAASARSKGPTYPNLAGRVVELQTELASARRELTDAQSALQSATQLQAASAAQPVAVAAVTETPAAESTASDTTELQNKLAETEARLETALRGFAVAQRNHDEALARARSANQETTAASDILNTQVATLTAEVEELKASATNQSANAQAEIARLNESLASLQNSTAPLTSEVAATRALLAQMRAAQTTLANENYELKSRVPQSVSAVPPSRPAPVATASPAAPAAPERTHVIVAGDSLSKISQLYYGTPNRWQLIYAANREQLATASTLTLGLKLRIP